MPCLKSDANRPNVHCYVVSHQILLWIVRIPVLSLCVPQYWALDVHLVATFGWIRVCPEKQVCFRQSLCKYLSLCRAMAQSGSCRSAGLGTKQDVLSIMKMMDFSFVCVRKLM